MDTREYYNKLAPYYHYIYKDWESSILKQAKDLNEVIINYWGCKTTILDATSGIGTQSIGLAKLGYQVTGIDIADQAIDRARNEAQIRDLNIEWDVCDIRNLNMYAKGRKWDLIISCDNAIPHLLSDREIKEVFSNFFKCSCDDGGCIISVRDYNVLEMPELTFYPRQIHIENNERFILFDIWKPIKSLYEMSTFIIRDDYKNILTASVLQTKYYRVKISKLILLLQEVGFTSVIRRDDAYFQPLLICKKSSQY